MSEQVPLKAVLLGHGGMPDGMADAVRHITGLPAEALTPVSNRGKSPEALGQEVSDALGDGPAIVFTDLQAGSCGFVARRLAQHRHEVVVISGVNLPVLIEFAMNRTMPLDELVPRLLARGRAGLGCTPSHLEGDERRSLQG